MITFHYVSYKNFLGTGDQAITIDLDKHNTTLVTGPNGSGKSTMLDALCFGLFGKPYRNINKPQLVNAVNSKKCEVTVGFSKGDAHYMVKRGIAPAKFEVYVNGEEQSQEADTREQQSRFEAGVLGMDFTAFTQIVILGSARYQSFMDLTAATRKEVVEGLLDINIFSKMNDVLSERAKALKTQGDDLTNQKMLAEAGIKSVQRLIDAAKSTAAENQESIDGQIEDIEGRLEDLDKEIESQRNAQAQVNFDASEEYGEQIRKLRKFVDGVGSLRSVNAKKIGYYQQTHVCAECGQNIDSEFAHAHIERLQANNDKMDADVAERQMRLDELERLQQDVQAKQKQHQQYAVTIGGLQASHRSLKKQIEDLRKLKKTEKQDTTEYENELAQKLHQLKMIDEQLDDIKTRGHHMMVAKALLKDTGIKAKIVAQYLPVMNQQINRYLDMMGADYSFTLDASFNEIIKSRYRDRFSYNSFSEGQKMRIDLALMFTWREVARMKNSVSTNLLILDEVGDSSLDGNGASVLWEVLASMTDSNIFVISHRATNAEMFDNQLTFKQVGNFSKLAE